MKLTHHATILATAGLLVLAGCKEKPAPPAAGTITPPAMPGGDVHSHGPTVQLGAMAIGPYSVKASFDGQLKAGADLPVDVWVTVPEGGSPVKTVRFWLGGEDAAGSAKARAELEKDNWHTHAEVPATLALDAKLWVEIENEAGETAKGGFALTH